MIDSFLNWIGKGELPGFTADELTLHLRHTVLGSAHRCSVVP
ncbi:hypothetical protein [Spirosoma endophyticum]|nr:hypothetical protein [Spirosoma endophyticum]